MDVFENDTTPSRGRGRPSSVDFDQAMVDHCARKWSTGGFDGGTPPLPGQEIKHAIRGLLVDVGLSAVGLAQALGLSGTVAYRWLNGGPIGKLTWKALTHWHAGVRKERADVAAQHEAAVAAVAAEDALTAELTAGWA